MSTCPCCSDTLLRHIQHGSLYWFCRSCWAEMPNFAEYRDRAAVMTATTKIMPHGVTPVRQPLLVATLPSPTRAHQYSDHYAEMAA